MHEAGIVDPSDVDPRAQRRAGAWVGLQRALCLRPREALEVLRRAREPEAALRACGGAAAPADELAVLARLGVRGVPFASRRYPPGLARLVDAPPLLWVRGEVEALEGPAVAVVGARAPSAYGRAVARSLGRGLAGVGVTVVSGLARGIDAEAHEGALEAGGCTVAFLACGPDRVYPAAHRRLAERVARCGAVVTEFPLGTPPRAPYFPLRNRLISALGRAVVVVEARERSGSLVTARHAADQGVEVLAVPGPIDAATSRGPNRLLRDGAHVLLELRDVLDVAGLEVAPPAPAGGGAAEDGGDGTVDEVVRRLAEGPCTPDELARGLALAPEQLAGRLLELRLAGRVDEDRDGRVRLLRSPCPPLPPRG